MGTDRAGRSAPPLRTHCRRYAALSLAGLALVAAVVHGPAQAQTARNDAMRQIGRAATAAEVQAWDIDVRADFKGLPPGSGSVQAGEGIWEAKCASCHGTFGESNEVFTALVGGTTPRDIETGRVETLAKGGFPQRTTLMKVSKLSTLWDYINRAMPWNAPKSLSTNEVYAALAYVLHLGEIVPADFTLSNHNMAEVQKRMPNRNGKVFFAPLWNAQAKGDVVNPLCMKNCPVEGRVVSVIPDHARNTHGNIADQVRDFGEVRGTDTSQPPRTHPVGTGGTPATTSKPAAMVATAAGHAASALLKSNACVACHGLANQIVGPSFQAVAEKYSGKPDALEYLSHKIRQGGQGVWGRVPMPAQAQLKDTDARTIAQWLAEGAK